MVNKINCICAVLEEINGFASIHEFERFQQYLDDLVNQQELIKCNPQGIQKHYSIPKEKYRCNSCHCVWILEHPDFPFKGLWKKK